MEQKSQNQIIADFLKAGNSIDPLKAQEICGTLCLSQRISNLRRPPYNLHIKSDIVVSKGNYHSKYSLDEKRS